MNRIAHRWTPTFTARNPMVVVQWCADCGTLWREQGHDQDGPAVQEYKVVGSPDWVGDRPPCRERGIVVLAAELYATIRVVWLKQPDFSPGWLAGYELLKQAHAMKEAAERHDRPPRTVFGADRADGTHRPKASALLDSLAQYDGHKS